MNRETLQVTAGQMTAEQMTADATATLESLRDLDGIIGSFLVGETGVVAAQDLPSYFGSAAYDVGPRAGRLREALAMSEGDVGVSVLRFGEHKLALRPVGKGLLSVLASADVNMPALRMAMSLVAKKLGSVATTMVPMTPPPPTVRPSSPDLGSVVPPAVDAIPAAAPTGFAASRMATTGRVASAAPEAQGVAPRRKRPVFFRGKRVQ